MERLNGFFRKQYKEKIEFKGTCYQEIIRCSNNKDHINNNENDVNKKREAIRYTVKSAVKEHVGEKKS